MGKPATEQGQVGIPLQESADNRNPAESLGFVADPIKATSPLRLKREATASVSTHRQANPFHELLIAYGIVKDNQRLATFAFAIPRFAGSRGMSFTNQHLQAVQLCFAACKLLKAATE